MTTQAIKDAVKHVFSTAVAGDEQVVKTPLVTITSNKDESTTMKCVVWNGTKDVAVETRPRPLVTDRQDAIIRVTTAAICGSDLHLYLNAMPGMRKGDILGHEAMGVVESVGDGVHGIQPGDRVVVPFDIACGQCFFCKKQLYSACDSTNPSKEQEALYGSRTAGIYGYSHLTGGWDGGQAEFLRVPFADINLLKVPVDGPPDRDLLLLSDVLCTAWHANELAEVGEGDVVAIWGAGPVGALAAQCAFARGASRVLVLEKEAYRLQQLRTHVPRAEGIDSTQERGIDRLRALTGHGPDCAIEAVGFHYCSSIVHKLEMALKLETDPSEILNDMIMALRKGGRMGVVGVYAGFTNHLNIGAFMEKGLSMRAGQTPVQKYMHQLRDMVLSGTLKPAAVVTHEYPLDRAPEAYKMFNDKTDHVVKVLLTPPSSAPQEQVDKAGPAT